MKYEYGKFITRAIKFIFATCFQWGDSGKGKIVDIYAEWARIIARGTGGPNAGHTICYDGEELITHIVPSGILYDKYGKYNVIGSGTVVDPRILLEELEQLRARGLSYDNLMLALNAKLILPTEIVLDGVKEAWKEGRKVGTTGRGIGPTYADFIDREGLVVNDLINRGTFVSKLRSHLLYKKMILKNCDSELLKQVMSRKNAGSGRYYDPVNIFDEEAIVADYLAYGQDLKPLIRDTDAFLRASAYKFNILGEGAQGNLLSIDCGTYPFVTGSDCSMNGLAKGMGLNSLLDPATCFSLGILKFPYMTRVGAGSFPEEMGSKKSDEWCNGGLANREKEKEMYGQASVNDPDEFIQGIGFRQVGGEYGATTQRPRRTGWISLPLLRHVLQFNRPDVSLMKLDVADDCETIKICDAYEYQGPVYNYGSQRTLRPGDKFHVAIPAAEVLQHCQPIYKSFPGWCQSLAGCSKSGDLPRELKNIIKFVIDRTGIRPRIVSIGPDRKQTLFF